MQRLIRKERERQQNDRTLANGYKAALVDPELHVGLQRAEVAEALGHRPPAFDEVIRAIVLEDSLHLLHGLWHRSYPAAPCSRPLLRRLGHDVVACVLLPGRVGGGGGGRDGELDHPGVHAAGGGWGGGGKVGKVGRPASYPW